MKSILGVSLGHDTSFAHIVDGKVVSVMEAERYFRQKRYKLHCITMEPGKHISGYQYVSLEDMELFLGMLAKEWGTTFDALAVQNQGRMEEFKNFQQILGNMGFKFGSVHHVDHHLSHAALAFFSSPFKDSLVLSYDGEGNDGQTIIFGAKGNKIEYLHNDPIRFGQSYNNMGYIVGIKPEVEGTTSGKVMGLTAYGEPVKEWMPYARDYIKKYVKASPRQVEGLNNYGKAHRINDVSVRDIPDLKQYLRPDDDNNAGLAKTIKKAIGFNNTVLRLNGPEDKTAQNFAATVQIAWTEAVIDLLKPYFGKYENLCIVGGCALNGVTNYEIQQLGVFKSTHFVPNPSDCGLSAGAALYVYWNSGNNGTFDGYGEYFSPYLGSEVFDKNDLPSLRDQYPHMNLDPDQASAILANLVYSDNMVGVIRGRYEVGPRALGNRSILCNPLNKDMKDIVNKKVKHREWYRPFAPIAIAERAADYFTNTADIPYMSVICYTRPEYRTVHPEVTYQTNAFPYAFNLILKNPFMLLYGMLLSLKDYFSPNIMFYLIRFHGQQNMMSWVLYLLTLAGGYRLIKERRNTIQGSLILFLLAGVLLSVAVIPTNDGGARALMSTNPINALVAGLAFSSNITREKRKYFNITLPLPEIYTVFLGLICALGPFIVFKFPPKIPPIPVLSCPDGTEQISIFVNSGSYINIVRDGPIYGFLPEVRKDDIKRRLDDYYSFGDVPYDALTNFQEFENLIRKRLRPGDTILIGPNLLERNIGDGPYEYTFLIVRTDHVEVENINHFCARLAETDRLQSNRFYYDMSVDVPDN